MRDRLIAQEPFHRVNGDGLIKVSTIARAFTGVITDAAVDRGHRVVLHQLLPGLFVGPFFRMIQPGLDVLAGRACLVTGRQMIRIDRPHGAPVTRVVSQTRAGIERDGEGFAIHTSPHLINSP